MGLMPRTAAGRILLLLGLAAAQPGLAQTIPSAALPAGIPALADRRPQCFLPGEKAQYDKAIDATRVSVPGCAKGVIPPQAMVQSYHVYARGSNATIDCTSLRQNEFSTRYLDTFLKELVEQVDGGNPACAANMLYSWAKADAMTEVGAGGAPSQTRADIMWTLAGASSAYLISPEVQAQAKAIKGSGDQVIRRWFTELTQPVAQDIDATLARNKENNIQYWRAFAILPTALMTENPALLQQSKAVFDRAMQAVTANEPDPSDNGYLLREVARGDKALAYQDFAAQPLVGMLTLSQAYGCEFLRGSANRQQFVSLMARTVQGTLDPDIFSRQQVIRDLGEGADMPAATAGRSSPRLLYLVDRFDPALYEAIDGKLAQTLGKPQPVVAADYGADTGRDRLGGQFSRIADAAAALRTSKSARLATVCSAS